MQVNWTDHFYYDETSPSGLRWACDRYNNWGRLLKSKGDIAGSRTKRGYWNISLFNKSYLAHRIVYELVFGEIPENMQVDHINGNRALNTACNLRLLTAKHNQQNKVVGSKNLGVFKTQKQQYEYWVAHWREFPSGESRTKTFSVLKYGDNGAKLKAIQYRSEMIRLQITRGADYTDRHLTQGVNNGTP